MTFVLAAGVTVGIAGVLGYLDNKETLNMLDYLKKENAIIKMKKGEL